MFLCILEEHIILMNLKMVHLTEEEEALLVPMGYYMGDGGWFSDASWGDVIGECFRAPDGKYYARCYCWLPGDYIVGRW